MQNSMRLRLPDTGSLDIRDFSGYMETSKVIFYENFYAIKPYIEIATLTDFKTLQLLGSGSFGFVILSQHIESRNLYALKCVDKEIVIKAKQIENLKTEQRLLQSLNYPFTIYLLYTLKDQTYIYFVLPFVDGGDLYGHLKTYGKCNEDQAKFYASQIILALEYLHYLEFVYRDLKPENILIDRTGYLKLSDFGFSKQLSRRLRTYTLCGTPEYMAPEILLNKGHGLAVDWWAVGVFIYELVAGYTPFYATSVESISDKIIRRKFKIPKFFSSDLRELVGNLLQTDLTKRYGNLRNKSCDIKQHKWLCTINWLALLNRKIEPPNRPKVSLPCGSKPFKLPKSSTKDKYAIEFADF